MGGARNVAIVPIKLPGPVGKHKMAEVVHVAATRLVWQGGE